MNNTRDESANSAKMVLGLVVQETSQVVVMVLLLVVMEGCSSRVEG